MNKIRIIGLVLLVIGIIIQFTLENDSTDVISVLLIVGGSGLIITGTVRKSQQ